VSKKDQPADTPQAEEPTADPKVVIVVGQPITDEIVAYIKGLSEEVATLEEQGRAAAEQTAEYKNDLMDLANQIEAAKQELADIKSRWEEEVRAAVEKALKKSKGVVKAVEGEGILLAKDVREKILEVRNGIQHFETQCHFDDLLHRLGIK
jgi:phage shock protein A